MASTVFTQKKPAIGIRCVHLDLKGLPPTRARLLSLLDTFATMRINAVLAEWEDMFPWTVDQRFRCETAYTPADIRAFAAKAKRLGIEIIPLVQCLGHMETVLRHREYINLREIPENNDVINPLAEGARELIERMVDDVLALIPDVTHFHLGGDEAWTFGSHPDTKAYIKKHGAGALYMKHVGPILDKLNARAIRPILWHDMMTHWDNAALNDIKNRADLCVWGYGDDPRKTKHHFAVSHIKRFKKTGIAMWAGTAYKGGDGLDRDLPDLDRREMNMLAWGEVAHEYKMKGIIITAWSRYSTNQMQVSPIDGALDALALGAIIAHDGKKPKDRTASCMALLKRAEEDKRFVTCRDLLAKLSSQRMAAWENVRIVRGYIVCATDDIRRAGSYHAGMHLQHLTGHVANCIAIAPKIQKAFTGLIPAIWVERYLNERIRPLQDEVAVIRTMFNKIKKAE
ncbi:MAG: family 20 glycosylhydrolase [Spirochaetes bacterium]|nr:family 20 glycosylhydrolase [Spirochaetota bacterium]